MRSLDLFSGAGGLTRGLHDAGWDTVAAVEIDPHANETYAANFPGVELVRSDIRSVDFRRWRGTVDLVVGGPPCQPFSVAGRQRSHEDPRDCVPDFIRAVRGVQPVAFMMENVPGLASPRHRTYLLAIVNELRNADFHVTVGVLDAARFGVPQFRRRLFVVGTRDQRFLFPEPAYGYNAPLPYITVADALCDVPHDIPNRAIVTYAKNPVLRPQPWDGMLVNGGGRPINQREPSQTIPASAGGNRTHILDDEGILVNYHAYLMAGGKPRSGVVEGVRRLTVRESARIQSFPDKHEFLGRQTRRYNQVGNAVPPRLAAELGSSMINHIQGISSASGVRSDAYYSSLSGGLYFQAGVLRTMNIQEDSRFLLDS